MAGLFTKTQYVIPEIFNRESRMCEINDFWNGAITGETPLGMTLTELSSVGSDQDRYCFRWLYALPSFHAGDSQ